jgi:hypothetical protein
MRWLTRPCWVGLIAFAVSPSILQARQVPALPYDQLFKLADLVLIVKPLSVRDAVEADAAVPPPNGEGILVGVVTQFEVLHAVKGEQKKETFELVTFRLKEGVTLQNGPCLVSFPTEPTELHVEQGLWPSETNTCSFLRRK